MSVPVDAVNGQEALNGGGLGITPPAKRNGDHVERLERGGEDWFEGGLGVDWGNRWPGVRDVLEKAQSEAHNGEGAPVAAILGNVKVLVRARGLGSEGAGVRCKYAIEVLGAVIGIQDLPHPKGENTNVRYCFSGEPCMLGGGVAALWPRLFGCLEEMGGRVVFDKLSRVDLCCDFAGMDVGPIAKKICLEQHCITRAAKMNPYLEHYSWTGVQIGAPGAALLIRMYDKERETRYSPVKREYLERERWGGPVSTATRVEAQIRREVLKQCGISSVSDYLEKRGALASYVFFDWFRMTEEHPDRAGHRVKEAAVWSVWEEIQEAFSDWCGCVCEDFERAYEPGAGAVDALVRQAAGCLAAAHVALKKAACAPHEFLKDSLEHLKSICLKEDWLTAFKERCEAVATASSFLTVQDPWDDSEMLLQAQKERERREYEREQWEFVRGYQERRKAGSPENYLRMLRIKAGLGVVGVNKQIECVF